MNYGSEEWFKLHLDGRAGADDETEPTILNRLLSLDIKQTPDDCLSRIVNWFSLLIG